MPDNPEEAVWPIIRKVSDRIGEQLTTYLRDMAKAADAETYQAQETSALLRAVLRKMGVG